MKESEIHHFLIGCAASAQEVTQALDNSAWLAGRIERANGFWLVQGRAATLDRRHARDAASQALWPLARRYGCLLAHLPFVRMVTLTGALAMRNPAHAQDDIDYMIVTAPRRVWLARALAVLVVRLARVRGVGLCPNYVMAETVLVQDRRDLFMAHELAQMVPLAGLDLYTAMRAANAWTDDFLPNARQPFYTEPDARPRGLGRLLQRAAELVLAGRLGDALEAWERRRKLRKFAAAARKPGSAARLDEEHVKGHFEDRGYPIMAGYEARLRSFQLPAPALLSGD
jgi:GNAT superfamily N-acetyltransferase